MGRKITGGSCASVRVIADGDLEQNGGNFSILGKTAMPVYGMALGERKIQGGKPAYVYVVSDAQLASGEFLLSGGAASPVIVADHVQMDRGASGTKATPVYVVGGEPLSAYYVDAELGDDSSDGRSHLRPWKTISKVNGESFNAGEQVLFKRGETWREQLIVPDSGSAGLPIVFGAYGSGGLPLLSGAILMTGWADSSPPADVYETGLGQEPTMVWFDGVLGTLQANEAACTSNNDWFWGANVLYINSSTGPDAKVIEASTILYSIDQNEKSYLLFENLKLEKGRSYNAFFDGIATDITLHSIESTESFESSIIIGGADTPSSVTIDGCTISLFNREKTNARNSGVHQRKSGDGSGGDNLIIRNCTISSDVDTDNSGNTEDGIQIAEGDNILIENNNISAVDHGIQMLGSDISPGSQDVETFTIRYNLLNTYDDCFWLNGTTEADSSIYYNLVTYSGDQYFAIQGEGGEIYNNTCYGGNNQAIRLITLAATKVVFKNNIISFVDNNQNMIYIDDNNSVDISNSTFDNNLYYRSAPVPAFGKFSSGPAFSFADWQSTHSQDANGLNENPDFATPGTDFTLLAVSPCRDAGVDVSLLQDYAGVAVPQETNPAMGAYEYVG